MDAGELLTELRRLHAALHLCAPPPQLAAEWPTRLAASCEELGQTIEVARQCEAERRQANLEYRIVRKAYQRAGLAVYQRIVEHGGTDQTARMGVIDLDL